MVVTPRGEFQPERLTSAAAILRAGVPSRYYGLLTNKVVPMKKGIVALLILLALVVLISPALVGRLAEHSMDKNLDWATRETREVVVKSQGFDRGWFSSEGQHRIEIRGGRMQAALLTLASANDAGELPALIINTRLDHGLIAISSMSREGGTLKPGLGSAVSTLSIELPDGDSVELPGVIQSTIGLTGELHSNYTLEPGSADIGEAAVNWGAVDVDLTTRPANGRASLAALVEHLAIAADKSEFQANAITLSGDQRQSSFGFAVGETLFTIDSMTLLTAAGNTMTLGPVSFDSKSFLDGDRVSAQLTLHLNAASSPQFGEVSAVADVSVISVDARALGRLKHTVETLQAAGDAGLILAAVEKDAQELLASGFELRIDQLDIVMPQGPVTSKFNFVVAASDLDSARWTSVLLALDATADLRVPADLVDLAVMMNPEAGAVIAMGFLKKNGEFYEMKAAFKKMLLTINGAPMPIPLLGAS